MKILALHYKRDHRIMVRYEKDGTMFTDEVYMGEDQLEDTVLWERMAKKAIGEIEKIKGTLDIESE